MSHWCEDIPRSEQKGVDLGADRGLHLERCDRFGNTQKLMLPRMIVIGTCMCQKWCSSIQTKPACSLQQLCEVLESGLEEKAAANAGK